MVLFFMHDCTSLFLSLFTSHTIFIALCKIIILLKLQHKTILRQAILYSRFRVYYYNIMVGIRLKIPLNKIIYA